MIKLIDRQLVLGYFKAYFVCLSSLLSLYVVVDLFTNLDDFAGKNSNFVQVIQHIGTYYGYKITQIFDRLCEAIVLLAAMFTITLMQRNNEQLPLLAAGISTHRIVCPVLACACAMLTFSVLNQELVIPNIADQLTFDKDDPEGRKLLTVRGQFDINGVHIEGGHATRIDLKVFPFNVLIPESLANNLVHLQAKEARYIPDEKCWDMTTVIPENYEPQEPAVQAILQKVDNGHFKLKVREVDFDALTRNNNWYQLASTHRLYTELQKPESQRLTAMAVLFHQRLMRPLVGMLLVVLGLSIVLRDTNRNFIISAGSCLVVCGIFFVAIYSSKMLGENDILSPPLAAWMPVLIFGPISLVLFDSIQT